MATVFSHCKAKCNIPPGGSAGDAGAREPATLFRLRIRAVPWSPWRLDRSLANPGGDACPWPAGRPGGARPLRLGDRVAVGGPVCGRSWPWPQSRALWTEGHHMSPGEAEPETDRVRAGTENKNALFGPGHVPWRPGEEPISTAQAQ